MNWLKENWFKFIIAIGVLIVALSVAYYFIMFIPKRNDQIRAQEQSKTTQEYNQRILLQEQDCQKASYKFLGEIKETSQFYISANQNHFSISKNTCLLYYVTVDEYLGERIIEHKIVDVYTNKPIILYSVKNGEHWLGVDFNEFDRQQRKLFEE